MALGLARAGALVLINGAPRTNLQATATRIAAIGGRCARWRSTSATAPRSPPPSRRSRATTVGSTF